MRKLLALGLVMVLVCLTLGSAWAAPRVLHMITALDPNEAKIYVDAFEKAAGIKVEWQRLSAGECVARLKAEAKNPQFSIWLGGPSSEYVAAKASALLAPYVPAGAKYLAKNQKDPAGYWTGFYFGAIAFASNTAWFKEKKLPYPESWEDLLRPEFKGQISIAYPYTSGTAFTTLATWVLLWGEDKGFDYAKKLDDQMHHYNKSGSACVTQVGLGEIAIGIAFSHDVLAKGSSKGYPVALTFPKEGTGYEIGAMGVVQGGPEPDLARMFIDWMLTAEAQNLFQEWYRIPLNPDAVVAPGAVTKDKVNLIEYDDVWAGQNQARLIDKWRQLTGK